MSFCADLAGGDCPKPGESIGISHQQHHVGSTRAFYKRDPNEESTMSDSNSSSIPMANENVTSPSDGFTNLSDLSIPTSHCDGSNCSDLSTSPSAPDSSVLFQEDSPQSSHKAATDRFTLKRKLEDRLHAMANTGKVKKGVFGRFGRQHLHMPWRQISRLSTSQSIKDCIKGYSPPNKEKVEQEKHSIKLFLDRYRCQADQVISLRGPLAKPTLLPGINLDVDDDDIPNQNIDEFTSLQIEILKLVENDPGITEIPVSSMRNILYPRVCNYPESGEKPSDVLYQKELLLQAMSHILGSPMPNMMLDSSSYDRIPIMIGGKKSKPVDYSSFRGSLLDYCCSPREMTNRSPSFLFLILRFLGIKTLRDLLSFSDVFLGSYVYDTKNKKTGVIVGLDGPTDLRWAVISWNSRSYTLTSTNTLKKKTGNCVGDAISVNSSTNSFYYGLPGDNGMGLLSLVLLEEAVCLHLDYMIKHQSEILGNAFSAIGDKGFIKNTSRKDPPGSCMIHKSASTGAIFYHETEPSLPRYLASLESQAWDQSPFQACATCLEFFHGCVASLISKNPKGLVGVQLNLDRTCTQLPGQGLVVAVLEDNSMASVFLIKWTGENGTRVFYPHSVAEVTCLLFDKSINSDVI